MSYILDSLKKSEQKRKQLERPDLHSEQLGSGPMLTQRTKVWPWLLVVALLVNAILVGWYLNSKQPEFPVQSVARLEKPSIAPTDVRPAVIQPVLTQTSPEASTLPQTETYAEKPVATVPDVILPPARKEPLAQSTIRPLPVDDLPQTLQRELPPLVLSMHYFSSRPENSLIRLDGAIVGTGEELGNGLLVVEIVADGVVLEFRGRRIWLDRPQG